MPRLLLVDQDEASLRELESRLRAAGFDVESTSDPHEAAELAVRLRPDLIVIEADMSGYSGLELHECLQFSERARNVPVVYLTAVQSPSARQLAFEQGALAYLSKPYVPARLVKTLTSLLFSVTLGMG